MFIYKDGLVRLSTKEYSAPTEANLKELFMHLTNYSINKDSDEFQGDEGTGEGSKRTIKWMMEWLAEEGHDVDALWQRMGDVIIKTLLVALPANVHEYAAPPSLSLSPSLAVCVYVYVVCMRTPCPRLTTTAQL